MAIFDMMTDAPWEIVFKGDAISERYFTVDTAEMALVHQWLTHNLTINTYVLHEGEVIGFFNLIPLTSEAGELFDRQELREDDLHVGHILSAEERPFAEYAYLAAVAISDTDTSYLRRQAVAATLATLSDHILDAYKPGYLKRIYANPTTFSGNHMVRKMGLCPVDSVKKSLKENDIYVAEMDDTMRAHLKEVSTRYSRFVGENPWKE